MMYHAPLHQANGRKKMEHDFSFRQYVVLLLWTEVWISVLMYHAPLHRAPGQRPEKNGA